MENKIKLTKKEVEDAIQEILDKSPARSTVLLVKLPKEDDEFCVTANISGSVFQEDLEKNSEAFGDKNIMIDTECDEVQLTFIPEKYPAVIDNANEPQFELHHKGRFDDAVDYLIPGTDVRRSNTEQCQQILAWMKESGRYPLYFQRLSDGIHVELSELADARIKDTLERGEAVGMDLRKYKFENPGELYPMGGNICVRAALEGKSAEWYSVEFFV